MTNEVAVEVAVRLHRCADCAYWEPALTYFGDPTGQGGCRFAPARNRKGDKLRECNEYKRSQQMNDDIVFKTEDSIWQNLADGTKTWDYRRYDMSDDRIYRLCWGSWEKDPPPGRQPTWSPDVFFVSFLNKATGEVLKFRYRGMEFVPWAPGWTFLMLGGLIERRPWK
jgi:hypothetical protein